MATSHKTLALLCAGSIALSGCSSNDKTTSTNHISSTPTKTSTPPPNYSSAHVKANLISPGDIADRMHEIDVTQDELEKGRVISCSLSGFKLPGKPEIITRQFTRRAAPQDDINYAQLIAVYNNHQEADNAFQSLQQKARSCPSKRHVPAKRTDRGTTVFPHDDTWELQEGSIAGWRRLRGHERMVAPRSRTRYNVVFTMHDYAVRGNVVIATVYAERTEPGKSGDPIAKRATEVFTKQMQKLG